MFPIKVLPAAKILSPSNSTSDERMIAVFSCGLTFPQSLRSPAVYRAIRPDCWRLFFREPLFLNHFRSPAGLQGDSTRLLAIIFPGTTFPQSLSFASGSAGAIRADRWYYFSGTHFSSITSVASRPAGTIQLDR